MIPNETLEERINRKIPKKRKMIDVALGKRKADVVFKNATYLNVFSNEFCHGDIAVSDGLIVGVGEYDGKTEHDVSGKFVCPGFIDAHIHLESSLVSPAEFARAVVAHGTTTVVTDPHEIANVMGADGIRYMLEATENLPIDVHFMLPSCVPATPYDESGAVLDYKAIDEFYENPRVLGLAEMMNFVGVVNGDGEVLSKIIASQAHHKKIDGHAPGLSGKMLNAYMSAGVYSDHECSTYKNALEKLRMGQFIMIREGTAAQNLSSLMPLLGQQFYSRCMFATDDKHPNDLLFKGHIDYIVKEAISKGADPIIAIKVASHNAARYFLMNNKGAIAPGYVADLVVFDDFRNFNIEKVFKRGKLVCENGRVVDFERPKISRKLFNEAHDTFHTDKVCPHDFELKNPAAVIGMVKHEIITQNCGHASGIDADRDILKIAVIERHKNTHHIGVGYVKGYGLRRGAVATSIAHDSHNIIVVGANDDDIAFAVNRIIDNHGGIVVAENSQTVGELKLEIAGLMSEDSLENVNRDLEKAKEAAFSLGVSRDIDPFMTLSFASLPVIPSLRIMPKGVFDVDAFKYL